MIQQADDCDVWTQGLSCDVDDGWEPFAVSPETREIILVRHCDLWMDDRP